MLINFALAGRVDLLEALTRGRGAWTATVASECGRSAREDGLHDLHRMPGVFGEPLYMETSKEVTDTASIRGRMVRPGDGPYDHQGEAEAVSIIANRQLGAAFVTDDRQAQVIARAEGIRVYSTCQLLKLSVHVGLLTAGEAWTIVTKLRRNRRALHDSPPEHHTYMSWIAQRSA